MRVLRTQALRRLERVSLDDDLVIEADGAEAIERLPGGAFDLVYIDPPFNTGRRREHRRLRTVRDDEAGDRSGFGGRRYRSRLLSAVAYDDAAVEREPYMAPGLVSAEKAARGKMPTDVIWHTIVPTNGAERTGYPTQKPEGLVRRFVSASSRPGGWCLDFFAGSGTLGAVCAGLERRFVLIDSNPEAVDVMLERLGAPRTGRAAASPR